jgi:uncharacterized membrane protein YtjA (UPF0391 family)
MISFESKTFARGTPLIQKLPISGVFRMLNDHVEENRPFLDWHINCLTCFDAWKRFVDGVALSLKLTVEFEGRMKMLSWALAFFVLAIIAGVLGFSGIAAGASSIAQVLFFLFLVLFLVSLFGNLLRGRPVS